MRTLFSFFVVLHFYFIYDIINLVKKIVYLLYNILYNIIVNERKEFKMTKKKEDLGGVWRTVGGRRIFIKDGQDLYEAMNDSGKFTNLKKTNKAKQAKTKQEKWQEVPGFKDFEYNQEKDEVRMKKEVLEKNRQKKIDEFVKYNPDWELGNYDEQEYDDLAVMLGVGRDEVAEEIYDRIREKNINDKKERTTAQVNKEYEELSKKMQADDYYYRVEDDIRLQELRAEYDKKVAQGEEDVNLTSFQKAENEYMKKVFGEDSEEYKKYKKQHEDAYGKDYFKKKQNEIGLDETIPQLRNGETWKEFNEIIDQIPDERLKNMMKKEAKKLEDNENDPWKAGDYLARQYNFYKEDFERTPDYDKRPKSDVDRENDRNNKITKAIEKGQKDFDPVAFEKWRQEYDPEFNMSDDSARYAYEANKNLEREKARVLEEKADNLTKYASEVQKLEKEIKNAQRRIWDAEDEMEGEGIDSREWRKNPSYNEDRYRLVYLRRDLEEAKRNFTESKNAEEQIAQEKAKWFAEHEKDFLKPKVDKHDLNKLNEIADNYEDVNKYDMDDISRDYINNRRNEMSFNKRNDDFIEHNRKTENELLDLQNILNRMRSSGQMTYTINGKTMFKYDIMDRIDELKKKLK